MDLQKLIPQSNRLELAFAKGNGKPVAELIDAAYSAGFVGAFVDDPDQPDWARRAAQYMKAEFRATNPNKNRLFSDIANTIATNGDGERHINCRHALEAWELGGRKGVEPYTTQQDYGSCVDASATEMGTCLFGYRAALMPSVLEQYLEAVAWYWYSIRGYCSDGWNGDGVASAAIKLGCAFRVIYNIGGNQLDLTDDDQNEYLMAREWCRSGPPKWLQEYTKKNHPFEDGAITEFDGGTAELKKALAGGACAHHSGTFTSGGSRPFTDGRTGAHAQGCVAYDDTDEYRKWLFDNHQIRLADTDYAVINHQTWGKGWRGECADTYWPKHLWGPKPQGAWVCTGKKLIDKTYVTHIWLPRVKGFPKAGPPPIPKHPRLVSQFYAEQAGQLISIRGEAYQIDDEGNTFGWVMAPNGDGTYSLVKKPVLI